MQLPGNNAGFYFGFFVTTFDIIGERGVSHTNPAPCLQKGISPTKGYQMSKLLSQTLNYVQVESETAFIDSRVYCREIIQVHHGDWLQNVLYQYQALIEQHFGVLRFENGKLLERGKGSLGGRPEKYALLTEAQCNFALSLSNNSPEVVIKKAELVADFEKAKQLLKEQFKRQFALPTAAPTRETEFLDLLHEDVSPFPRLVDELWKDSGISSKYHVRNVIKLYFTKGTDYSVEQDSKGKWVITQITEDTYTILMLTFRSYNGCDISKLEKFLMINRDKYFQLRQRNAKRKNEVVTHDQLSLEF